jgi:hypothetical protein
MQYVLKLITRSGRKYDRNKVDNSSGKQGNSPGDDVVWRKGIIRNAGAGEVEDGELLLCMVYIGSNNEEVRCLIAAREAVGKDVRSDEIMLPWGLYALDHAFS